MILHPKYPSEGLSFNPVLCYETTKAWLRKNTKIGRMLSWDDFEDRYHTALELFLRWTPNTKVLPLTAIKRIFVTVSSQVSRQEPLDSTYQGEVSFTGDKEDDEGTVLPVPDELMVTPDPRLEDLAECISKVKLHPRQQQILELYLQGYSYKEIGQEIGKSFNLQDVTDYYKVFFNIR